MVSLAGNRIAFFTPWSSSSPAISWLELSEALGVNSVAVKAAEGYLATSKKSGLLRCPVSCSSSEVRESVLTEIRSDAGLSPASTTSPSMAAKEPLWSPVSLAPTKPSELLAASSRRVRVAVASVFLASAGSTFLMSSTLAFGLLSISLEQARRAVERQRGIRSVRMRRQP